MAVVLLAKNSNKYSNFINEFSKQLEKELSQHEQLFVITSAKEINKAETSELLNTTYCKAPVFCFLRFFYIVKRICSLLSSCKKVKVVCSHWSLDVYAVFFVNLFFKKCKYSICNQELQFVKRINKHVFFCSFLHRIKVFFRHKVIQNAERIFVFNHESMKYLSTRVTTSEHIEMIQYGVDISKFYPKNVSDEFLNLYKFHDKKIILSVGPIIPKSGQETVIRVLGRLDHVAYSDVLYVIIGEGIDSQCQGLLKLAKNLRVDKRIVILGEVGSTDLLNFFNICDIFIDIPYNEYVYNYSNCSLSVASLYAFACKKTVIASRMLNFDNVILEGKTGTLVEPQDIEDLKPKLKTLLDDSRLRERYGEEGYHRVREFFTWEASLRNVVDWVTN